MYQNRTKKNALLRIQVDLAQGTQQPVSGNRANQVFFVVTTEIATSPKVHQNASRIHNISWSNSFSFVILFHFQQTEKGPSPTSASARP